MRLPAIGLIILLAGLLFGAQPVWAQSAPGGDNVPAAAPEEASETSSEAIASPEVVEPTPAPIPAPARPPLRPSLPGNRSRTNAYGLGPNTSARTISLDVRGVNIDDILRILANAAGLTIVKDPELNVQLTIICPRPVTIDEALEILNAELSVIGYTTVRQGQVLKVTLLEDAVKMVTETHIGTDPEAFAPGDRLITQIVPLQTLDASSLADELGNFSDGVIIPNLGTNTLYITASASNVQKLLGLIGEMEKRSAASVRRFQLKYVAVEDVADLLTDFLTGVAGGGGGGTRPTYERNLLPRRNQPARPGTPTPARPATQSAAAATGGGGGVQVLTDARTNSLIVQASPERLDSAAGFLAAIDIPVDYSSSLAVIPLKYARPEQIAERLTAALGGTSAAKTTTSTRTPARTTSPGTTTRSSAFLPDSRSPLENPGVVMAAGADGYGGLTLTQSPDGAAAPGGRGSVVPLIDMSDVIIVPDTATGSLIINASPEKLQIIRQLVEKLDVVPTQVLVQAIIAEVSLSKTNQLGIEWTLQGNNIFHTGASDELSTNFGMQQLDSDGNAIPLLGLSWSILKPDRFEGLLNALGKDSNVRILSTPKIFTTSGEMATIDVSTQVPFATGQQTSDAGSVSTSFEYKSVGIVLEVTPTVSQDGTVTMEVSQTADDLIRFETLSTNLKVPVVSKRLAEATVSVQDGNTAVLGGLISDRFTRSVTGIPILKDLPLIGWAFRNKETIKEKTELLVFLTPYVVRNPEECQMLTDREKGYTEDLKRLPICPTGPEQ